MAYLVKRESLDTVSERIVTLHMDNLYPIKINDDTHIQAYQR